MKNMKNPESSPRKSQKELTQEKLIQALLQFPTVKAAADSIGITDRTAYSYLDEPDFQKTYEQARLSINAELRNGLIGLASKATQGLYDLMNDEELAPAIKARVYQYALDRGIPVSSESSQQDPLQGENMGVLIPNTLLPYMDPKELEEIERFIALAGQRKAQAEKDREAIDRNRL